MTQAPGQAHPAPGPEESPAAPGPGSPAPSRRDFLKHLAAAVAMPLAVGVYARQIEPFWVEYHDVPMPVRGLSPALAGLRLAHLTDLHAGDHDTPWPFLESVVARVRAADPDLVLITGDLITDAQQAWFDRVVELLAGFGRPTIMSFGNHEYGKYEAEPGDPVHWRWTAEALAYKFAARGVVVLRNRAVRLTLRGQPLWLVGLDDLWGGYFKPAVAFAGVPADQPRITLSHNPDTGPMLVSFDPGWVVAGHTHGGQVRLPFVGAPILPVRHKHFDRGRFELGWHSSMYVSRGVGFLRQARFLCRPEVPTYVLEPEA